MGLLKRIKFTVPILALVLISSCKTLDSERMKIYDSITTQVLNDSLPNLETGEARLIPSNDVQIWYELIETSADSVKGTVLFIEGLEGTAMGWGEYTYQPLLNVGYNVIRMDNRDVGRSTWTVKSEYDLSDMAKDVLAVVNDANLNEIHLVGQSLGGMIAQEFALSYPEKVQTLTLIYTSGNINDKSLPEPSKDFFKTIIAAHSTYSADDIASKIKLELATMDASNVMPLTDEDLLFIAERTRYELEKRKGKNENASKNQQNAIDQSGSRYDRLHSIKTPTLIVHGTADPLITIEHGIKLARLIPHAKTLWIEDYGHNLPMEFSKRVTDELIELIEH